jgi:hypothetical protein
MEPSHNVWESIQRKLFWKQFLSFRLNSFNIYYTLVVLAIPVTFPAIFLARNPGVLSDRQAETGQAVNDTLQSGVQANAAEQFKILNSKSTYQNLRPVGRHHPDQQKIKYIPLKNLLILSKSKLNVQLQYQRGIPQTYK